MSQPLPDHGEKLAGLCHLRSLGQLEKDEDEIEPHDKRDDANDARDDDELNV